ncbi:MAG: hypothetical protein LBQ75_00825 [Zoogloeaceae bacterium]|jgi:hypothetical protein|nr:hypothetical protein [Zoogloeaceae bacterium]
MVDTAPHKKTVQSALTPAEAQRFIATLPAEHPARALEMVVQQLDALTDDMEPGARFAVVSQLDEASHASVEQVFHEYLGTLSQDERSGDMRLWQLAHDFWTNTADQYGTCASVLFDSDEKGIQQLRDHLPRIIARSLFAAGESVKWKSFRYLATPLPLWCGAGSIYLLAEKYGFADKQLQIYPGPGGISSSRAELLKILFFQVASLNSLQVVEMEIADRLITQLLPNFIFSEKKDDHSFYWINLGAEQEPSRINNPPPISRTLRYFGAGEAVTRLQLMKQEAENTHSIPAKICQNDKFEFHDFLNVIDHLATQWSHTPPQRQHERHRVHHRIAILRGFVNSFVMTSPEFGGKPAGLPLENWIVEDVSQGGFGALVKQHRNDWVQVGALLALQPQGANSWIIGLIRRVRHASDKEIRVGIQTLSRRPIALEVRTRAMTSALLHSTLPVIWFHDDDPKEPMRFVFPAGVLNEGDVLEFTFNGRGLVLQPLSFLERGSDYDLVRCKIMAAARKEG